MTQFQFEMIWKIIENGAPVEQNNNARLMFALIIAICWAIIIIIP